jgi:hypothetical protein
MRAAREEKGQASVELVALLPLIAVVALVCWQAVLVGQAIWLSASAARRAARATAIGADPAAAARSALPPGLERGMSVRSASQGRVRVTVRVPSAVGAWRLGGVTSSASFPRQAG